MLAGTFRNEITITFTKWRYRLVRGFWSFVHQIATGLAGGGLFNGNTNREVISVPFLNVPLYTQVMRKMREGARAVIRRVYPTG